MKQLIDFIPLIIFFTVYKMDPRMVDIAGYSLEVGGAISGTFFLIIASVIVYGGSFIKNKTLEKSQMITLMAVVLFGGMTLAFQDENFLKWKAPIVNWIFAAAFLGSQFVGQKSLVQRMMEHAISLPDEIWIRMNLSWVVFFALLGAANLYVAFTFHEFWVDFKVFGSLILTFVFVVLQFLVISRHIQAEEK
ncbi:septation protein IspZ [Endozoicomonas sp. 8E]|uniref:septation protein IspZ n=1 Tax=Endozoicomonas sp. 8E TaxID=3035692 RepID=UPI002938FEBC|nr:septation protein IspZ [Endozoicomonas sp. 8E]WOG25970.1 septation protein IspZ [Endozoicomonas sp. 8E]